MAKIFVGNFTLFLQYFEDFDGDLEHSDEELGIVGSWEGTETYLSEFLDLWTYEKCLKT